MLLGCLKTFCRQYQILDWYWAQFFLWQNGNIAKCVDGRDVKSHSKGSKFLLSKCLYWLSPDWLGKLSHSSHFPKRHWKKHQKPFLRQMSCRSWEKVAIAFVQKSWGTLLLLFLFKNQFPSNKDFWHKMIGFELEGLGIILDIISK